MKMDVGIDADSKTIYVGMLSDLTGPFGPLVSAILAGSKAYWGGINAAGGVNGYTVDIDTYTRDTQYVVDNHIQFYNEIHDKVVAIGHSTGSPHTVAIAPDLAKDGMLAIPLTWYSGWSDPAINANLVPHGTPYCIEAMNTLGYITEVANTGATKIAIASLPGDYGQDSAQGAKKAAEAAGLEIVYDGEGAIVPSDETTLTAVADGISGSGAEIVWVATTPSTYSAIYGQAIAKGFKAIWSGPSPSWSPAFVAPDSPIKDAIAADFIGGTYTVNWATDEAAATPVKEALSAAGAPISDYYFEGVVEASILHAALVKAFENGDVTRAGVLAAAKSLDNVDFNGLAPAENYSGAPNDAVQRKGYIFKPDPEGLAGGTTGGTTQLEKQYTSSIAAAYTFDGACYKLS
jgi:ABC-type branched-subunit amino acid transport system substrate-binding protein